LTGPSIRNRFPGQLDNKRFPIFFRWKPGPKVETIGLDTAEELADELGVCANKRAATSTLDDIIAPSLMTGGTTKLAARVGNISEGKNGEMIMGCVSEVLTT